MGSARLRWYDAVYTTILVSNHRFNSALVSGGSEIQSYLVEWSSDDAFRSPSAAFVNASGATLAPQHSYQLTGLHSGHMYRVRVSAGNTVGYSQSALSIPAMPASRAFHRPNEASFQHSSIPNRLQLVWQKPLVDVHGFTYFDANMASFYRIQWATDERFDAITGTYDLRTVRGDGESLRCGALCTATIGIEVQTIIVASNNGEPLESGSFKIVYVGPSSPPIKVLPEHKSRRVVLATNASAALVTVLEWSLRRQPGSYCTIWGSSFVVPERFGDRSTSQGLPNQRDK
jgi:hypothetical protein